MEIKHPKKIIVPLATGVAWGDDGAVYQEKLDGEFTTLPIGGGILVGETVAGKFTAFDCVQAFGCDCRLEPLYNRMGHMRAICRMGNVPYIETCRHGGELLQRVLAAGGEGVVRKSPDSNYYGVMLACKRIGTWLCRVTAQDLAKGSGTIADAETGENRGTVPLRSRVTHCRVGSIIKVEGLELTAKGKIRDPRPCKDSATSWLVKY